MRISDWSSDVCSSDLPEYTCNLLFRMEKYSAPVLACRLGNLWHGSCSLPREKESSMAEPQVQLSVREIRKSFPGTGGDIPGLNGLNFDIYEQDLVPITDP